MWVSLWGKGIWELKEFPFISKFRVSIKTQLMKTSKAHSHGKHYCPTIISETRYADILTRNWGWKERVPLILRGLVTVIIAACPSSRVTSISPNESFSLQILAKSWHLWIRLLPYTDARLVVRIRVFHVVLAVWLKLSKLSIESRRVLWSSY